MSGTSALTGRQLLAEVRDVVYDLPVFLTAPLYRRWHCRWGATPAEIGDVLPGDTVLPHAQFRSTRAITINAPRHEVWPWLVQVGCGRGGFYSDDLLDNLGRPSATTIVSDLQHLEVGQWVPMSPSATPSDRTAFKVQSFEVNAFLLWSKPDGMWAWRLTPAENNRTRLVTRVHAVYDWRHPLTAAFGVILMEFGDFAMQRRMLRGIKARSEAHPDGIGSRDETPRAVSAALSRSLPRGANVIGLAALVFSALYLLSDVIEMMQGGFSGAQLWLTLLAEAAVPIFIVGLAVVQRPRIGLLGECSAFAYAYSYVFFTGTVVYALLHGTKDYAALSDRLGPLMVVHGAVMVIAGIGFGYAVLRAKLLPAWTAVALMVGVILVAAAQGLPAGVQVTAAGVRDLGFAGMGAGLLRRASQRLDSE
jgi:hypothetical protein